MTCIYMALVIHAHASSSMIVYIDGRIYTMCKDTMLGNSEWPTHLIYSQSIDLVLLVHSLSHKLLLLVFDSHYDNVVSEQHENCALNCHEMYFPVRMVILASL